MLSTLSFLLSDKKEDTAGIKTPTAVVADPTKKDEKSMDLFSALAGSAVVVIGYLSWALFSCFRSNVKGDASARGTLL